ncbi:hypothetical protein, partial [Leptospira borgpetersenii]|uniref:hypothetical protein n=1 Tax=Leptospira borgpetersenii TaxID=174 RepID=UPI001D141A6B
MDWLMIALVFRGSPEPAAFPGLQGFLKSRAGRGTRFRSGTSGFLYFFVGTITKKLRQNGAPSGLEKRGLDASIYHKTK